MAKTVEENLDLIWKDQQKTAAQVEKLRELFIELSDNMIAPSFGQVMNMLESLGQEVATLKEQQGRESPVVVWSGIVNPETQTCLSITARAGATDGMMSEVAAVVIGRVNAAREKGWVSVLSRDAYESLERHLRIGGQPQPKQEEEVVGAPAPPATTPPPPAANGQAPSAPPAAPSAPGSFPTGVADLESIEVDAHGRVKFHVKGFKWAFKDSRGAETVVSYFDDDLGWTLEHFAPGSLYSAAQVQGLVVTWEKPDKWYNVVRVSEKVPY